jgi:hypothetical protein
MKLNSIMQVLRTTRIKVQRTKWARDQERGVQVGSTPDVDARAKAPGAPGARCSRFFATEKAEAVALSFVCGNERAIPDDASKFIRHIA